MGIEPPDRCQFVRRGKMRITHGHFNCLVSEQLGYCSQIDPFHDQPGSERVPKIMPREVLDASDFHSIFEPIPRSEQTFAAPTDGTSVF
jgi:hypothetical protein